MDLVKYPDPLLQKPTFEVTVFNEELKKQVEGMLELMYSSKGLGLAGPQAGLSKKIIVLNPTGKQTDEMVFLNPRIIDYSGEVKYEEGCLSFPGIYAKIDRPEEITCVANTLEGSEIKFECDELLARIIQHEIDHLNGVLLVDRMSPVERKAHQRELRRMRKEYKG